MTNVLQKALISFIVISLLEYSGYQTMFSFHIDITHFDSIFLQPRILQIIL